MAEPRTCQGVRGSASAAYSASASLTAPARPRPSPRAQDESRDPDRSRPPTASVRPAAPRGPGEEFRSPPAAESGRRRTRPARPCATSGPPRSRSRTAAGARPGNGRPCRRAGPPPAFPGGAPDPAGGGARVRTPPADAAARRPVHSPCVHLLRPGFTRSGDSASSPRAPRAGPAARPGGACGAYGRGRPGRAGRCRTTARDAQKRFTVDRPPSAAGTAETGGAGERAPPRRGRGPGTPGQRPSAGIARTSPGAAQRILSALAVGF